MQKQNSLGYLGLQIMMEALNNLYCTGWDNPDSMREHPMQAHDLRIQADAYAFFYKHNLIA